MLREASLILVLLACNEPQPGFVSALHPEQADTRDDLVALALTTEGDTEGFGYAWSLDGEELEIEGSVVPSSSTSRGQIWSLRVRHDSLPGEQVHELSIDNAPPGPARVQVWPEAPHDGDALSCELLEEPQDADGDELSWTITWFVDGEEVEGESIEASRTTAGEEWSCRVVAHDGLDEGEEAWASAVLLDRRATWPESAVDLSEAEIQLEGETNSGSGFNAGEWAGWRLAGVGDVDGDGLDDVLTVGRFNDTLADDAGKVYLMRSSELSPELQSLGELSTAWLGEGENDHLGRDMAGPGDLDGDGLGDLLMSTFSGYEGAEESGTVHLLLSSEIELGGTGLASDAHFTVQGRAQREWVGRSLDGAGDLDGDGVPDLFVGIPGHGEGFGRAAVFEGSQALAGGLVFSDEAAWIVEGTWPQGSAGIAVTRAGDMDGDGVEDLGLGGWLNGEGAADAGKTWIVLGGGLQRGVTPLSAADHAFLGTLKDQSTGRCLAEVGDFDGDGLDDLLTGGHGAPETGLAADGAIWLILGSELVQAEGQLDDLAIGFVAAGEGDYAGDAQAAADVDGDGRPDLLFGAHMNALGGQEAGAVYLFLNDSVQEPGRYSLDQADRIWVGESSYSRAGVSLQGAGDVNGDGADDIVLGATTYDSERGKTYLLLSPFFE